MQRGAGSAKAQPGVAPASALRPRSPVNARAPRRQLEVFASTIKGDCGTQKSKTSSGTRVAGKPAPTGKASGTRVMSKPAPRDPPAPKKSDDEYVNVTGFPFPLGPFVKRPTIAKEIVRGSIWGFEQPQSLGGSNVTTNVRMTIVRLQSGGLWVHAPIAPTRECVRMVRQLEEKTGEKVKYVVLPTFGYEHKIFVGPFSRRFPKAEVWVAPSQWSWPINLPAQFFGIFPKGVLRHDATDTPWAAELEQKVFESSVGIGPYIEVAFFHKKSRSLLVTDAVISVPNSPPELVPADSLLEASARNFFINVLSGELAKQPVDGVPLEPKELTPAARTLGWRRMAMQILYIVPGDLRDPTKGFLAIAERLIVGPILKTLVFSTTPEQTREWVDSICSDWNFNSVIPAHFTAPVRATPADFKAAFSFVYEPQLSAERAAAAAAASSKKAPAATTSAAARKKQSSKAESANPAKVLDGVLISVLGGLRIGAPSKAAAQPAKPAASAAPNGFSYPAEDIAALNAAKRVLVSAGVVNK